MQITYLFNLIRFVCIFHQVMHPVERDVKYGQIKSLQDSLGKYFELKLNDETNDTPPQNMGKRQSIAMQEAIEHTVISQEKQLLDIVIDSRLSIFQP